MHTRKRKPSEDNDDERAPKKVARKQYRKICSADACTNLARAGEEVCVKHGAKVKLCSSDGCTNQAKKGGVCIRHGAKI